MYATLLGAAAMILVVALVVSRTRQLRIEMRGRAERFEKENLIRLLRHLLTSGYDGAWMVLEDRGTQLRVQFRKYVEDDSRIGIVQEFPRAEWSEPYYRAFQETLQSMSVPFSRVPLVDDNAPPEFVRVDFGEDIELAAACTERVFRETFGIAQPRMRIEVDGIGFATEPVRTKGHPTLRQVLEEIRAIARRRGEPRNQK